MTRWTGRGPSPALGERGHDNILAEGGSGNRWPARGRRSPLDGGVPDRVASARRGGRSTTSSTALPWTRRIPSGWRTRLTDDIPSFSTTGDRDTAGQFAVPQAPSPPGPERRRHRARAPASSSAATTTPSGTVPTEKTRTSLFKRTAGPTVVVVAATWAREPLGSVCSAWCVRAVDMDSIGRVMTAGTPRGRRCSHRREGRPTPAAVDRREWQPWPAGAGRCADQPPPSHHLGSREA